MSENTKGENMPDEIRRTGENLSRILGRLGLSHLKVTTPMRDIRIEFFELLVRKRNWTNAEEDYARSCVDELFKQPFNDNNAKRLLAESCLGEQLDDLNGLLHVELQGKNCTRGNECTIMIKDSDIDVLLTVIRALLSRGIQVSKLYLASNLEWVMRFTVVGLASEKFPIHICHKYEAYKDDTGYKVYINRKVSFIDAIIEIPRLAVIGGKLYYPKTGDKRTVMIKKIPNYVEDHQVYQFIWHVLTLAQRLELHFAVRFSRGNRKFQLEIFEEMTEMQEKIICFSILEWMQFLLKMKTSTLPEITKRKI